MAQSHTGGRCSAYLEQSLPCSPREALSLAAAKWGMVPSQTGHSMPAIDHIRDTIFRIFSRDERVFLENSLVISLSHTHWEEDAPTLITYEASSDRYLIGPSLRACARNLPVSFAWLNSKFVAYEWADKSCAIDADGAYRCLSAIDKLGRNISMDVYPFGISLNFRFKVLRDQQTIPVIENPVEVFPDHYIDASSIEPIGRFENGDLSSAEIVAWHIRSDERYFLTADEKLTLQRVREIRNSRQRA